MQAVIFDVDGVLLDSVPYHFRAWQEMFEGIGMSFTYEDYVVKVNGLPRETGIRNIATNATEKECKEYADAKQKILLKLVDEEPLKPLDGVENFLTYLKGRSYKIAAASSSKNAPVFLKQAHIDGYFNSVISGNDFRHPKPDPEIFLTAAQHLGVRAEDCVVVEDAGIGVEAAKNAKMQAVGLSHSGDKDLLTSANFVVASLADYQKIIDHYDL